jgi:hypothetical protein
MKNKVLLCQEKSKKNFWEFRRDHLQLEKELGEGFFGNVYQAKAYGILYPGIWSTVAVKMARGKTLACLLLSLRIILVFS